MERPGGIFPPKQGSSKKQDVHQNTNSSFCLHETVSLKKKVPCVCFPSWYMIYNNSIKWENSSPRKSLKMMAPGPIGWDGVSWKPIHWNETWLANSMSAPFTKEIICYQTYRLRFWRRKVQLDYWWWKICFWILTKSRWIRLQRNWQESSEAAVHL